MHKKGNYYVGDLKFGIPGFPERGWGIEIILEFLKIQGTTSKIFKVNIRFIRVYFYASVTICKNKI